MKRSKSLGFLFVLLIGSVAVYSISSQNQKNSENTKSSAEGLIPSILLDNMGEEVSSDQLAGKYVGLYFSASWCGPCLSFTPELIRFREQHADNFEVVLVGGDGTPQDQAKYVKKYKMPWLSMVNQSKSAKQASQKLEVQYIPYLVILDPSGKVISKDGVKQVRSLKGKAMQAWKSMPKDA
jgi:thiol-disulfide isomerase/thioredoxin